MRIAIYSRKSVFTGKGDSIENQIQLCKEYVNLHYPGENSIEIYEDEGFSGGNINRPKFQELLKDAREKKFDCLICYRLDRISRNVSDFSTLIEELSDLKIAFVSIKEQFDTSTPMGRAMMYISSVFAQLERETIAERVRDNMIEMAKHGRWLGGTPPLGFDSESMVYIDEDMKERKMSKLKVNKKEIELVKTIYRKFLELGSIHQATVFLQQNRLCGKRGKLLSPSAVSKILTNPAYVKSNDNVLDYLRSIDIQVFGKKDSYGILTYNKRDNKFNKRDKTEWIAAVSKHKGIIEADDWLLAQRLLDKNREKSKTFRLGTSSKGLLSGLVRCSKCGSPMRVSYGRNNKHYYTCTKRIQSKNVLCDNPTANGPDFDKAVLDNIMAIDKSRFLKGLNSNAAIIQDDKEKIERINNEINTKKKQLDKLTENLAKFDDDIADILIDKINTLSREIKELQLQVSEVACTVEDAEIENNNYELIINTLDKFKDNFNSIEDVKTKKALLSMLIDEIRWNGDTSEIQIDFWGSKKKV